MAAERPSPPLNLNFSDQIKTAVTLTWDTPLSSGGSMITGYIVEKCDEGANKWLRCNARLCPELSYRVAAFTFTFTFTFPPSYCPPHLSVFVDQRRVSSAGVWTEARTEVSLQSLC